MANVVAPLNPEQWKFTVQDYLNNRLVSRSIANVKCEALLNDGDVVNFPYTTDVRVQSYSQGTDLTIDEFTSTQDSLTVNQSKAATFPLDRVQEKQARANFGAELAFQCAYQLSQNVDQTVLASGVDNANNTIAGGTLSVSNILSTLTDARAQLERNNAADDTLFAVMDPERVALVQQNFVANGFNSADAHLRNYFYGDYVGFRVYQSNNLAASQSITIATQPTDDDTVTLLGVTFTFKTTLGTTAGNVLIGANAAAAQTNLLGLINAPQTTDSEGVKLSVDNQRILQNAQASMAAFASNVGVFTAYGKIGGAETFTDATDAWGTETTQMLTGRIGAISLAMQLHPELTIAQEPKQLVKNYITHVLYGATTFVRDKKRLVKISHNA